MTRTMVRHRNPGIGGLRAWAGALLLLPLAACAVFRPAPLPAPETGAVREEARFGRHRCSGRECRDDVTLGARQYRVETVSRLLSPEEAAGRPARSGVARAGSAFLNAVLRANGWTTTDYLVGVGTRVAYSRAADGWRLVCDVAWIEEVERSREEGEEQADYRRLLEGMSCRAERGTSGAVAGAITAADTRFRFEYGLPTNPDSIGAALDALGRTWSTDSLTLLPMRLTRAGGATYVITPALGARKLGVVHSAQWDVRRADGTHVATLHRRFYLSEAGAIDVSPAADEEEASVLRLVAAGFVRRLEAP